MKAEFENIVKTCLLIIDSIDSLNFCTSGNTYGNSLDFSQKQFDSQVFI